MLACLYLSSINPKDAQPFPPELAAYLSDPAHCIEPLSRASRGSSESISSSPPSTSPRPEGDEGEQETSEIAHAIKRAVEHEAARGTVAGEQPHQPHPFHHPPEIPAPLPEAP